MSGIVKMSRGLFSLALLLAVLWTSVHHANAETDASHDGAACHACLAFQALSTGLASSAQTFSVVLLTLFSALFFLYETFLCTRKYRLFSTLDPPQSL